MNKKDNQSKSASSLPSNGCGNGPWGEPRCIITKMRPRDLRGGSYGSDFLGSTPICFSETNLIMNWGATPRLSVVEEEATASESNEDKEQSEVMPRQPHDERRQDVDEEEEWNEIQNGMDELINSDVNERIVTTLQANSGTDLPAFTRRLINSSQSFHTEFTKLSQAIADVAARPFGSDSTNTLVLHQGNVPPPQDNTNTTNSSSDEEDASDSTNTLVLDQGTFPQDNTNATYLSGNTFNGLAAVLYESIHDSVELPSDVDDLSGLTVQSLAMLSICANAGFGEMEALSIAILQSLVDQGDGSAVRLLGQEEDSSTLGGTITSYAGRIPIQAMASSPQRQVIAEISSYIGMIKGKIGLLETKFEQVRLALALARRKTRTLETEREVEAQTVTTLEAEVQQSRDDAEEANSERRRAETEAVEQQARIESLETEVMEQRSEGERKDETIEKLNGEINRLNQDRQRLQAEKEEADMVVAVQTNTIEEQDTTIAEQNTTIETLETTVAERDTTIRTSKQRRRLADAVAQVRIENLEREAVEQAATIETLDGQLLEAQSRTEELIVQARHWIRTLKQRSRLANSIAQVRIENLEREAAEQRAEVDHLSEDAQVKTCCCVIS